MSEPRTQEDRAVAAEVWLDAIRREYTRAREKHAPLNSGHEAIGVIEEEWEEFKSAVFFGVDHRGERSDPAHEAVQIAAMAVAYLVEAYPSWEFRALSREEGTPE